MNSYRKPTKEEILAAAGKTVPDVIAPGLKVLLVGINPGLYTAAIGHHFGRPGNRFWPALFAAGFTNRLLSPYEEQELLRSGYGITNLVDRATARADEVSEKELVGGAARLKKKIEHYHPKCIAILGIGAYREAFKQPKATLGRQKERFEGAVIWVLPNPSGINAHFTPNMLARMFLELRVEVERT